jgi:hypothetical protein
VALAAGLALVVAASSGLAQDGPIVLRLAFVIQWVVTQHREGGLRAAVERGVVDRTVFTAQRGLIQRSTLVAKPVRVVAGAEAAALGARGEFRLVAVRPPAGAAAWSEVEVAPRTGRPDDVLVLEVGGELGPASQVLDTIVVFGPDGRGTEVGLALAALFRGPGVAVLNAPFGRPVVRPDARARFHGTAGVEFLVIRSLVEAMVDAATTPRGRADVAPHWAGEWREGDRVFLRIPQAVLRAGPPSIVLGWKDRIPLAPLGDR